MKRIFLTGSGGFFGTNVLKALGDEYTIIPSYSKILDITDANAVTHAIAEARADYVIHASAIASSGYCNSHPEESHNINVLGTRHIAQACAAYGCRMIFLSSEQVFNGNGHNGPYRESDKPIPSGVYGETKVQAEQEVRRLCTDYVILRLTWLFDYPKPEYRESTQNILINTIKAYHAGIPFGVPAYEFRGMTYIRNLMDRFPQLIDLPTGLYHTGSEHSLSRYDTVRMILGMLTTQAEADRLAVKDTETYADRIRDVRLDTTKLRGFGIVFPSTSEALHNAIHEWIALG